MNLKWNDFKVSRISLISLALLLFYCWGVLGYFFTGSLDISYPWIVQYLGAVFLYFGLLIFVKNDRDLFELILLILFCAGIHCIWLAYEAYRTGCLNPSCGLANFRNKNILSSYLLFFFPLAIFLISCSSLKILKTMARCFFVLLLVLFFISGSKAGEGALIIQFVFLTFYLNKKGDIEELKSLILLILISMVIYKLIPFALLPNFPFSDPSLCESLYLFLITGVLIYLKCKFEVIHPVGKTIGKFFIFAVFIGASFIIWNKVFKFYCMNF